ncbi:MAG: MoaD/ThiS family protein [Candidatus Diapherotrites archaeon]|nr:MoaD/ThiS family protein [Candidatus Diapherotrites archaeon]
MKVYYKLQGKKKSIEMPANKTVEDLLLKIKQNPEAVLVAVDNTVIPENEKLKNGKTYLIMPVASGG